ncbi:hypothetical protein VU01_102011 [Candidatus Electrothrix marina]|uniref:DUF4911 domain-containing protein n=1 Tax=Candidatus Electrothrix marina TaxID=1859130 RepID=A0A444JGX4_9BACT|nr:hypothetical protein VU01_102011 [Candidatus Electrothrix marina]
METTGEGGEAPRERRAVAPTTGLLHDSMQTFYLRVRPDRIALFRFLLEGYDGLAVLSTMDAKQGLVRLIVPESRYAELWLLLFAICQDLCPAA